MTGCCPVLFVSGCDMEAVERLTVFASAVGHGWAGCTTGETSVCEEAFPAVADSDVE